VVVVVVRADPTQFLRQNGVRLKSSVKSTRHPLYPIEWQEGLV